jgi:hypothetical protein
MASLSSGAITFLSIEAVFFSLLVYAILKTRSNLAPLLAGLSKSLRLSEDLFGDERNFVTSARTRYKRAAERIEDVDAHAIASGELSTHEVLRLSRWRLNIGALHELITSASGVFITLGLLGTFIGLAFNLEQLGSILDVNPGTPNSSPGDLVQRLGGILAPMSTAFISSLGGVFFSLAFWLTSLVLGGNRLLDETEDLLTAYLEQVVQADCNRFSLMRASAERMERGLGEFMSRFSERVGTAIDQAMSRKVEEVFASIRKGADALETYAITLDQGVKELIISGNSFYKAATVFSRTDFAKDFGESVDRLTSTSDKLSHSANDLSNSLSSIFNRADDLSESWLAANSTFEKSCDLADQVINTSTKSIELLSDAVQEVSESSKQLRAARLAIGRENKTSDELSRTLINELRNEQPTKQAIADAISEIKEYLEQSIATDNKLAELVNQNLRVEAFSPVEKGKLIALLNSIANANTY